MPTTQKIVPIKGMSCASCANIISRKLKRMTGISDASINFATETAKISYDPEAVDIKAMNSEIGKLGYEIFDTTQDETKAHVMPGGQVMSGSEHAAHLGLNQSKDEKLKELEKQKEVVMFTLPISFFMFLLSIWDIAAAGIENFPMNPVPPSIFNPILLLISTPVLFISGRVFLEGVVRFIRYRVANMDTLVGIGTLAAYLYSAFVTLFPQLAETIGFPIHTYFDVAVVIIGFILLGKYLEARSKLKTGEAIEKLLGLQAKTALVIRNGKEVSIPIAEVVVGDVIIAKPGEKIAVDGQIISGSSTIDESMITGESMPVLKQKGETVIGATINKDGVIQFKATKVGGDTMLATIIAMVESAQGSKAPIEALADKVSSMFVPAVLVIALVTLLAWAGAGLLGLLPISQAFSLGFVSLIGVLVIACPCALGLATPTAIIVGTGKGASKGILIKDAESLETLHKVSAVVFDKTGTLTKGEPKVIQWAMIDDMSALKKIIKTKTDTALPDYVKSLIFSVERQSHHPLAQAIVSHLDAKEIKVETFKDKPGFGVSSKVDKHNLVIGTKKYMETEGVAINHDLEAKATKWSEQAQTLVYVSLDKKQIALFGIADPVKDNAAAVIASLHELKIHVAMITGDHANVANAIGKQLGIDTIFSQVLPDEKASKVKELQDKGMKVAMVGDGINDAPALAQADVGVAMGTGTDVAIEAADLTLLGGDVSKLTSAIKLSRSTFSIIKQNLFWAFAYNVIGIPIAAGVLYPLFGISLSPVFAGAAMALSSVSVVTNSLRLKNIRI